LTTVGVLLFKLTALLLIIMHLRSKHLLSIVVQKMSELAAKAKELGFAIVEAEVEREEEEEEGEEVNEG
jgi:hypothetical protein